MDTIAKALFRSVLDHVRTNAPTKSEIIEFCACYVAALVLAFGFTVCVGLYKASAQEHHQLGLVGWTLWCCWSEPWRLA
jgi:hypothetical protein